MNFCVKSPKELVPGDLVIAQKLPHEEWYAPQHNNNPLILFHNISNKIIAYFNAGRLYVSTFSYNEYSTNQFRVI